MKIIVCQNCASVAVEHGERTGKVLSPRRCEVCDNLIVAGEMYTFTTREHPVWWTPPPGEET